MFKKKPRSNRQRVDEFSEDKYVPEKPHNRVSVESESDPSVGEDPNQTNPANLLTKVPLRPRAPTGLPPRAVVRLRDQPLATDPAQRAAIRIPALGAPAVDQASLALNRMGITKLLKGSASKVTCLVSIGGATYVLKAGRDFAGIDDHVANTAIFNQLDIDGVRAPITQKLTDTFREALRKQLNSAKFNDRTVLAAINTNAQISTMTRGIGMDNILDAPRRAHIKDLQGILQGSADSTTAAAALINKLSTSLTVTENFSVNKAYPNALTALKDPRICDSVINAIQGDVTNSNNLLTLSYISAVFKATPMEVAGDMGAEVASLDAAKQTLTAHLKTRAGAHALGGMGAVDLVLGIDDRLVGAQYNGGNFMFDSQQNAKDFWCVDNKTDNPTGLRSAPQDEQKWKNWVLLGMTHTTAGGTDKGESIGQDIHWAAYTRVTNDSREISQNVKLSPNEEAETLAGTEQAVTDALAQLRALTNDNTNGLQNRARIAARLDFLQARKDFVGLLKFDEFQTIPTTGSSGNIKEAGLKAVRIMKAKLVNRTPEQQLAKTWKTQARDPATNSAQLDINAGAITQYLATHPNADRRVAKALFATRSAQLVKSLEAKTAALQNFPPANKVWGQLDPSVTQRVQAVSDRWVAAQRTIGQNSEADKIQAAMAAYAQQLANM